MLRIFKLITICIFVFILLVACDGFGKETPPIVFNYAVDDFENYNHEMSGVHFKYPKDWSAQASTDTGMVISISSDQSETDTLTPNIHIEIRKFYLKFLDIPEDMNDITSIFNAKIDEIGSFRSKEALKLLTINGQDAAQQTYLRISGEREIGVIVTIIGYETQGLILIASGDKDMLDANMNVVNEIIGSVSLNE